MQTAAPQARIRPKQREMELEFDIDWSTCGCHLIVDSLVLVADKHWNMKLTAVEIALRGRLRFVLKFSNTCMPGIEGAGTFASQMHDSYPPTLPRTLRTPPQRRRGRQRRSVWPEGRRRPLPARS